MARTTGIERAAPARAGERCISMGGRGLPEGAELDEAVEIVSAVARELRALKRQGGHEFKPHEAEVRLRAPALGGRGGTAWSVFVRVPAFVTPRDAREAARAMAGRFPAAKLIRLVPVDGRAARGRAVRGRDHQPAGIRKIRNGPQHRARDVRQ
jgi:hypothetical protein